jgi:hypothetical protein
MSGGGIGIVLPNSPMTDKGEVISKRPQISGLTPAIFIEDISPRLGPFGSVTALDGLGKCALGQPRKFAYPILQTIKPQLSRCASTTRPLVPSVFLTIVTGMNGLSGSTWKGARLHIGEAKQTFVSGEPSPPPLLPNRFLYPIQDCSRKRVQGGYTTAKMQTTRSRRTRSTRAGHVPHHARKCPPAPTVAHHPTRTANPPNAHAPRPAARPANRRSQIQERRQKGQQQDDEEEEAGVASSAHAGA